MKRILFFLLCIFIAIYTFAQYNFSDYIDAAKKGDPNAQHKVGVCYALGLGVNKDNAKAIKWYLKSANQGFAKAQNSLAFCYKKWAWCN